MELTLPVLDETWKNISAMVVYGFGRQGKGYIEQFKKKFNVVRIIDNGACSGTDYHGIPIVSFNEYISENRNDKIIITAAGNAHRSIRSSLLKNGKQEFVDFLDADVFQMVWHWQFQNEIYLGRLSIPITERCTLRCKNCITHMPYINKPVDYLYEELCNNMDLMFSLVDHIGCLNIVGGEPFMNPILGKYIHYLKEKYNSKIDKIIMISNGTVIPDDSILKELSSNDWFEVRLSDYTSTISYTKRFQEVVVKLDKFKVRYQIEKFEEWLDMGMPYQNIKVGNGPEEIKSHMIHCNGRCQFYSAGTYYYCSRQWAAEKAFHYESPEGDILVLKDMVGSEQEKKEKLLLYHIGKMSKGYCDYCNRCRGFDQGLPIKAAEQL